MSDARGERFQTEHLFLFFWFSTGTFNSSELDRPEIDNSPGRDNNVQTEDDMVTPKIENSEKTMMTTTPSNSSLSPKFMKPNELNKLIVKPSGVTFKNYRLKMCNEITARLFSTNRTWLR